MNYWRSYHPARAWGRWIFLAGFLFLAIIALTDIIPLTLQPVVIILTTVIIIIGAVIGIIGSFKSFDRDAYPILLALICAPVIILFILYLIFG